MKIQGLFRGATETREVPAGSVIFEAGESGEEMFGIIEGGVELSVPGGRVFELGPDDSFGEMALVDHSPRAPRPRPHGHDVGGHRPPAFPLPRGRDANFALQVMASMAERIRSTP